MEFVKFQYRYTKQIAKLHIEGISTGFISSLGISFVTSLYEAIAEDDNSFGFVAVEQGDVLGYVAFSENLSKLYKYVIVKKGFKFALVIARRMLSLKVFKKVVDNIFYPKKMKQMNLPAAELLSIVVAEDGRGKGIAKKLITKGLEECADRSIEKVKVLVSVDNEPANRLYQKCGFKLHSQINSHGAAGNIYVKKIVGG